MKETLIIYRDWWEAIKSLPTDMQLKAYNAICEYAFEGKHPEDPMIAAVTALMRSAIDRDNKKWENVRKKRAEAGRRGAAATNEKRWGSQQESSKSANVGNCQQMPANVGKIDKGQQESSKSSVNDNVNVNVNGIAYGNNKYVVGDDFLSKIGDVIIEQFCMTNHIGKEVFYELANAVIAEWQFTNETHQTESDARKHLLNQIRVKSRNPIKPNETKSEDRYTKRRGVDSAALRAEDYTGEV